MYFLCIPFQFTSPPTISLFLSLYSTTVPSSKSSLSLPLFFFFVFHSSFVLMPFFSVLPGQLFMAFPLQLDYINIALF